MLEHDDLLPISALQHMIYCERQAALIHVARLWADNTLTVRGSNLHETVDGGAGENRGDVRVRRSVPLRSDRLGLVGKADVVEFRRVGGGGGVRLRGTPGLWLPYPVEYKRGKPKKYRADEVQLCAQAICLEEMLEVRVEEGALFYGRRQRRTVILLDDELRVLVADTAGQLRDLISAGTVPVRRRDRRCDQCSLLELCMPPGPGSRSAVEYLNDALDGGT